MYFHSLETDFEHCVDIVLSASSSKSQGKGWMGASTMRKTVRPKLVKLRGTLPLSVFVFVQPISGLYLLFMGTTPSKASPREMKVISKQEAFLLDAVFAASQRVEG